MTANRGRERIIYQIMKAMQTSNRTITQLMLDANCNNGQAQLYVEFLFEKGLVYESHPKNVEHPGKAYYGLTADGCLLLQRIEDCGIFQLVEGFGK